MSEIICNVVRFSMRKDSADWLRLSDNLARAGMHLHIESDKYIYMPIAGSARFEALDFNYLDDSLRTIWDFCAVLMGADMCGYYLELPPGCKPAPLDPSALVTVAGNGGSKLRQAVQWLCAEPGRTQSQAAALFGVAQGNVSTTFKRMRRNGEI